MRKIPVVRRLLLLLIASSVLGATFLVGAPAVIGVSTAPCTTVSLSPSRPFSAPGVPVELDAQASGCATPQYQFYLQPPGGAWTAQGAYTPNFAYNWNTLGLAAGIWGIGVRARAGGTSVAYDVFWLGTYTLLIDHCQTASISAGSTSPQLPGASIVFTATPGACGGPEYKFLVLPPGGSWTTVRAYGSSSAFTWNTTGLAPGTWQIGVWVREAGSPSSYDAYAFMTFDLLRPQRCIATATFPDVGGSATAGTIVTFDASVFRCDTPQYQYLMLAPGGVWTVVQPYSSTSKFIWDTTGFANGRYQIGIWVRQTSSPNKYDTYAITTYYIGT